MAESELTLLGPPMIAAHGDHLVSLRRKSTALLAYLATDRRPHSRDELATLLWPDYGQTRARANLRRSLFSLNEVLGKGVLATEQDTIELPTGSLRSDVDRFLDFSAGCGKHAADEACEACIPLLEEACEIYRSDFLAGFSLPDCSDYDQWQLTESEQLRDRLASVLRRLTHFYQSTARWTEGVSHARRLVDLDPLEENNHRILMRMLARSGQRTAALKQYQECEDVLRKELSEDLEEETIQLAEAIREGVIGPDAGAIEPNDPYSVVLCLSPGNGVEVRGFVPMGSGRLLGERWKSLFVAFSSVKDAIETGVEILGRSACDDSAKGGCVAIHASANGAEDIESAVAFHAFALAQAGGAGELLVSEAASAELETMPQGYGVETVGAQRLTDLSPPDIVHRVVGQRLGNNKHRLWTIETVPNNLPVPATTLVGRKREIDDLLELLTLRSVRLLTLTGAAGTGKTRLSLHAAAVAMKYFPDGVYFVDLAPLQSPEGVPGAIVSALALQESARQRRQPLEVLTEHLRTRQELIILDNFEHLLPAARIARELLTNCPRLKLLVTSRSPVGLPGEREYPLDPLSLPDPEADEIGRQKSEAVQLFLARAAEHTLHSPQGVDLVTVENICRRLDALPLAIELAAPQLKFMSSRELLKRLEDRVGWLKSRSDALPKRQRSLEAAIQWSYDGLNEELKRYFRMLSIFVGGASLDAVVALGHEIESEGGLDGLNALEMLIDRSLVVHDDHHGNTRYRMLETIREYSRSKLRSSNELASLSARHAEYYYALAQAAEPELHGPHTASWASRLELEFRNLEAALLWFEGNGTPEEAAQFSTSLTWFWFLRGHFSEGRRHIEHGLERLKAGQSDVLRGEALYSLGWITFVEGDWISARGFYQDAVMIFRATGHQKGEALACSDLGVVERFAGNYDGGTVLTDLGVKIAREVGDPYVLSTALIRAYCTTGGKFPVAPPLAELEEAIHITKETGDTWAYAHVRNGLGDLYREIGEFELARTQYRESLDYMRSLNDRWMIAWNLEGLGRTACLTHDPVEGLGWYRESLVLFHALGNQANSLFIVERVGSALVSLGLTREAASILAPLEVLRGELPLENHHDEHPGTGTWGESRDLSGAMTLCRGRHPEVWEQQKLSSYGEVVERSLAILDQHAPHT